MIRQICLSCYKTVELPDDTAGKDTPCPSCGKVIAVPPKYAPGVAEGGGLSNSPPPLPPLPPVPPTPSPGPKPGASPMSADPSTPPGLKTDPTLPPLPPPPLAGSLTRGFGFGLDPRWLDWVPAACLLLAVVLTFLPWVEMKLGGYTVMTQNGWEALFAGKGDNPPRGKEWEELDNALAGKSEKDTVGTLRSDWLLVPYLMLLFALVVLFAAERVIRDPAAFPPTASMTFLPPIWKWRLAALGGLAVLAFLILWFQSFQGFGLQRSIHNMAVLPVKEKLADNPSDVVKRELWIKAGQVSGQYPVHQTLWLNLLLVLHAVAVVATAARFWVDSRGAKAPPRLDVRW